MLYYTPHGCMLSLCHHHIQCSLDLPFFKGREKMIGECGKTENRKTHFFKQKKSYIVLCFLAEFCLN
jgi:hypothetical protein